MIPDAFMLQGRYADLKMPVAGEEDRLIDIDSQSARLHSMFLRANSVGSPGTATLSNRLRRMK
jgi:hypothetical protein